MESNFYRGNASEQSTKFSDKEKKLLRDMKFESCLDKEVNLKKIDIDVIKPWITQKITTLLGMEDDVVNEYVFTQLEEKELNPKKMQINLTGFLNARRARLFMGELWNLLIEAQETPDGIPMSLVQMKIEELKASDQRPDDAVNIDLKDTSSNWNNRYSSLTYGKYKPQVKEEDDDEEPSRHSPKPRSLNDISRDKEDRRRRDNRSESPERRRRKRSASPERRRKRSRSPERHRRKRSRSPEKRKKKRDRSTERRDRKRSRSPERHRRRHKSRSPERREKKRSRSPRRREKKRTPSSEHRERSKSNDS
jgi:hypothetical protein